MRWICDIDDDVMYKDEKYHVLNVLYYDEEGDPATEESGILHYEIYPNYVTTDNQGSKVVEWDEVTPLSEKDITSDVYLPKLDRSMISWRSGLETRPDNSTLPEIFSYLSAIQYDKEGSYGSSWCAKGEHRSIIPNIDRKYDRLSKITDDEIAGIRPHLPDSLYLTPEQAEQLGESKIDAVADLANYCLLYLGWLRKHKPGAFKVWVDKNVPKYLQDRIPFIQEYYQQYRETGN